MDACVSHYTSHSSDGSFWNMIRIIILCEVGCSQESVYVVCLHWHACPPSQFKCCIEQLSLVEVEMVLKIDESVFITFMLDWINWCKSHTDLVSFEHHRILRGRHTQCGLASKITVLLSLWTGALSGVGSSPRVIILECDINGCPVTKGKLNIHTGK